MLGRLVLLFNDLFGLNCVALLLYSDLVLLVVVCVRGVCFRCLVVIVAVFACLVL